MDAKETSLYTSVLIVCVVIGIIIGYFVYSIIKQQRRMLLLQRKNILAEITTLEKERARIAADFHDELGPQLSSVKMRINSFDLQDEQDKHQIQKTNLQIDLILKRIREISFDMMPTSLSRKGLVAAVNEFVNTLNSGATEYKFNHSGSLEVGEQIAVNVYRIIQESVHNSVKHSRANQLSIDLRSTNKKIFLDIVDDGVGFNKETALAEANGIGLRSILSRVEMLGGILYLESEKNKGTKYNIEIPI